MTDTVEAPVVLTPDQELEAVKKELPKKHGEYRRIHPLFPNHYRVNFHNDETNVISRSYFVRVAGNKVTY